MTYVFGWFTCPMPPPLHSQWMQVESQQYSEILAIFMEMELKLSIYNNVNTMTQPGLTYLYNTSSTTMHSSLQCFSGVMQVNVCSKTCSFKPHGSTFKQTRRRQHFLSLLMWIQLASFLTFAHEWINLATATVDNKLITCQNSPSFSGWVFQPRECIR